MVWWFLGVSFLVGGAGFWSGVHFNRSRLQGWKDAAAWSGLQVVEASGPLAWRLRIAARSQLLEVRIEGASQRAEKGSRIVIKVSGPPGFSGVRIRRQTVKPAREIEVGDEPFDDGFRIEGPLRLVTALLDSPTRRLLARAIVAGEVVISGCELEAFTFDGLVPELLPLLVELGQRLAQPLDIAGRLADNALKDPEAGVRLRNLMCLVREFPGEPGTIEVLRNACMDLSPEVRLRAARELGAEGREVLVQLAEGDEDDATTALAISFLGGELPFERAQAMLSRALRSRRFLTVRACFEVLSKSGADLAVEMLAKVMTRETGELAVAAAQALGTTGSPAAEAPLIAALDRVRTDLRVAAAIALGSVGSAAAVLTLKQAAEGSREPALRRAARQAIAEIQARLPGASPGQLSLAGAEAGQLSLAQAEAGQLSFAKAEAGQLALASDPAGRLSIPPAEAGPG